jgi:enoyl-CoA hydratase/carnithine racemase
MEIDTGTTELLCSVRDGVALITLNRPEARNAMSPDLTAALRDHDQGARRRRCAWARC